MVLWAIVLLLCYLVVILIIRNSVVNDHIKLITNTLKTQCETHDEIVSLVNVAINSKPHTFEADDLSGFSSCNSTFTTNEN